MPYQNDVPVAVEVNGHQLVILTTDEEALLSSDAIVADYALPVTEPAENEEELEEMLVRLAETQKAGIVVAPSEISLEAVIDNLKQELPWLH